MFSALKGGCEEGEPGGCPFGAVFVNLGVGGEVFIEGFGGRSASYESLTEGEGCGAETVCCFLRIRNR